VSESEIGGEDCERQAKAISGAVIDISRLLMDFSVLW